MFPVCLESGLATCRSFAQLAAERTARNAVRAIRRKDSLPLSCVRAAK